jgi:predicted  nucleic acid-binding Zn-ribbon protein
MKIEEQELQSLKEVQQKQAAYLHDVGVLESQKHNLLHALAQVSDEQQEIIKALEEKYGNIEIDLADGSYKEVSVS